MRDNIYRQAIQVQDACNLSGVVHTLLHEILPAVRNELHNTQDLQVSTNHINTHPAVQMFAFKIVALASGECMCDRSADSFAKPYDECKVRSAQLD